MQIDQLILYPLKSARGITVTEVAVGQTGFFQDRAFAVINSKKTILTAREKPELLKIDVTLSNEILTLSAKGKKDIYLNSREAFQHTIETSLFKKAASALTTAHPINNWLTAVLNEPCQLIMVNKNNPRFSNKTVEATPITFNDSCPVHLINNASLTKASKIG